jgi:hypothetical protein
MAATVLLLVSVAQAQSVRVKKTADSKVKIWCFMPRNVPQFSSFGKPLRCGLLIFPRHWKKKSFPGFVGGRMKRMSQREDWQNH